MKMVVNVCGLCLLVITLLGAACASPEPVRGTLEHLTVASATSDAPDMVDSHDDPLTNPQPTSGIGGETEMVETAGPSSDSKEIGAEPGEPDLTPTVERGAETPPERGTREDRRLPERVPSPEQPIVTGEVPQDILDAIFDDLIAQTGADRAAIEMLRAEAVVWNDGSLGCPKPGQFYTQAVVPGYWVVLRVGSQEYDYRASKTGHFLACENSFPSISPPSDRGGGLPPEQ